MFDVVVGTIEDIVSVENRIPEFDNGFDIGSLRHRLEGKSSLILVIKWQGEIIAYKVGYEISPGVFYSWIGGVVPEFRRKGIATLLRRKQEEWATEHGYAFIAVKSMNGFPAMLTLLISSGYQISGYEDKGSPKLSKIEFIKQLQTA